MNELWKYTKEQLEKEQIKSRSLATKVDKLEDELQTEKGQKSKMEKEVVFLKQRETQLQESVDNLKQNLEDVRIAPQSALLSG